MHTHKLKLASGTKPSRRHLHTLSISLLTRLCPRRASFNGMRVATEVPYKKAFELYKPLLEGLPQSRKWNPREILKQAFLTTPRKQVQEAWYHKAHRVVDTVSMKEAKQQFADYTPEQRTVYQDSDRQTKIALTKARKKIATAYRVGMLAVMRLRNRFSS